MSIRRLLPVVALSLASLSLRAEGPLLETTVDAPRETKVAVGLEHEKAVISWVESQWEPEAKDVSRATETGSREKSLMLFRFTYTNAGWISHKLRLSLVVLSEDNKVLATGSRSSALDKNAKDDTITVPVRIKTADWGRAKKIRITAAMLS